MGLELYGMSEFYSENVNKREGSCSHGEGKETDRPRGWIIISELSLHGRDVSTGLKKTCLINIRWFWFRNTGMSPRDG